MILHAPRLLTPSWEVVSCVLNQKNLGTCICVKPRMIPFNMLQHTTQAVKLSHWRWHATQEPYPNFLKDGR